MGEELVIVQVAQGALRGKKSPCRAGGLFYSFKGVPYAKPPVGSLRFKDPQPPVPWGGIRDALKEGSICTQFNLDLKDFIGSEDCLYLNVYAPEWSNIGKGGGPMLPVMMWIHGGGFASGSGTYELYGGDFLAAQGVVVVTINYRLGPFGFLYLGHPAAAGNYGLKDQVAALRWVKKNIAAFGGDPDNVTIFGESAGGASVHFHMLSPMSKGLFHRAVAMSGSVLNPWAYATSPGESAARLGHLLGCNGALDAPGLATNTSTLVACLRAADATALLRLADAAAQPENAYRFWPNPFLPSAEVAGASDTTFLPEDPETLMREGRFSRVPLMMGFTNAEGIIFIKFGGLRDVPARLQQLDENFAAVFAPEMPPNLRAAAPEVVQRVRHYYFGDRPVAEDTLLHFVRMCTDMYFTEGIVRSAELMTSASNDGAAPLYMYEFSHDGPLALLKHWLYNASALGGVAHGDDLAYIFEMVQPEELGPAAVAATAAAHSTPIPPLELSVRSRQLALLTNFAKEGNPTPEGSDLPQWFPFTTENHAYAALGDQFQMRDHVLKERMDFWRSLPASV